MGLGGKKEQTKFLHLLCFINLILSARNSVIYYPLKIRMYSEAILNTPSECVETADPKIPVSGNSGICCLNTMQRVPDSGKTRIYFIVLCKLLQFRILSIQLSVLAHRVKPQINPDGIKTSLLF